MRYETRTVAGYHGELYAPYDTTERTYPEGFYTSQEYANRRTDLLNQAASEDGGPFEPGQGT